MPIHFVCAAIAAHLLALSPFHTQETPRNDAKADAAWQAFDRVDMIVNQDIVTLRNIVREVDALQRKGQLTKDSDLRMVEDDIRSKLVKRLLSVQAGKNMGLEATLVERQVRLVVGRETDHFDGVVGLADHLQSLEIDAIDHRREVEESIYSRFWTDYVTGEGPAPQAARVSVDRYVRPGLLAFHYRNLLAEPGGLPAIGGLPQRVTLQFLVVDPKKSGRDLDAARKLAIQLRERILDGEDFVELNEKYGAARIVQPEPLNEARLRESEPSIGAFVSSAHPGDVSEVMPYTFNGTEMWRIIRLVAREEAQVPEISSLVVQKKLTELYETNLAAYRRDAAIADLARAAYIWPQKLRRRPDTPAAAPQ